MDPVKPADGGPVLGATPPGLTPGSESGGRGLEESKNIQDQHIKSNNSIVSLTISKYFTSTVIVYTTLGQLLFLLQPARVLAP